MRNIEEAKKYLYDRYDGESDKQVLKREQAFINRRVRRKEKQKLKMIERNNNDTIL